MGNNSILATNAALYKKLSYDPERDFAPITMIGTPGQHPGGQSRVPAHSMAELIALAKASPGQLNFASSGHGAAAHLAGELFKTEAKVNIVHVPYKGAAPALQDVMAGHVQMMFATAASVIGLIKSGKVRALAVTTPQAHRVAAGLADGGRARHQGLRRHHLARPGGADRHAAGGHRHAALRRDGGVEGSGHASS
jgi:tripartite-type tricarboxylate transporter receptor subunit TctC